MFCKHCGKKTELQGENIFYNLYKCSKCNKTYSEKKEWLKQVGAVGSVISFGGIILKIANGDYVEAATKVANKVMGDDDITNA